MWSAEIYFPANIAGCTQAHIVIWEMCLSQTQKKKYIF